MSINERETNQNRDFFNQRLDEIRMSGHERLKAKARFAQAEAMAAALFGAAQAIARLYKRLTAKRAHPASTTAPSTG